MEDPASDQHEFDLLASITDQLLSGSGPGPKAAEGAPGVCYKCGEKVVAVEGEMACRGCALSYGNVIDTSVEGRGLFDDSRRMPVERMGMPINPLLPRSSMTTFISVNKPAGHVAYTYIRTSIRNRLDPSERPKEKVFREFDTVASVYSIPPAVVQLCKANYNRISQQKINRGNKKDGVKAACMYFAFKQINAFRSQKHVATMFNTQVKHIIAGTKAIYTFLNIPVLPATPSNHVVLFARSVGLSVQHIHACEAICRRIEALDAMTHFYPESVAATVIAWFCQKAGLPFTRQDVADATDVSNVTISKCLKDMAALSSELTEATDQKS